jgi:hypothetical protein
MELPYEIGDRCEDSPAQQVICWLQDQAKENKLVKDHFGNVHEYSLPHVPTPLLRNGNPLTIAQWVDTNCDQSILNGKVWGLVGGNSRFRLEVIKELEKDTDTMFPVFHRNPGVYSFKNGILDLTTTIFYHFSQEGLDGIQGDREVITHHHKLIQDAPVGLVPMVHLVGYTLDNYDHTLGTDGYPTPLLQSTLEYQQFSQEAIDNIYSFVGICLFPLNHPLSCPQWEIGFHSVGVKGTAKSLWIDGVKECIAPELVGCVSAGSHSDGVGGGLQAIEGKSLMLQSEATQIFAKKIEPATFCQLLSHEQVSITKKGKDPQNYLSHALWWIASNEGCGHEKHAQCMRRLITIPYTIYLDESKQDLTLKARIKKEEIANLIIKSFLHFELLKERVGPSQNVRNFLAPVFKEAGEATQEEHNPMVAYLEHLQNMGCLGPAEYETVKTSSLEHSRCKKFYCEETDFKLHYKEYCNRHGFDSSASAYSRAIYQSPFGKFNITIKKKTREYWPPYINKDGKRGPTVQRSFLYGVWCYEYGLPWKNESSNGFLSTQFNE